MHKPFVTQPGFPTCLCPLGGEGYHRPRCALRILGAPWHYVPLFRGEAVRRGFVSHVWIVRPQCTGSICLACGATYAEGAAFKDTPAGRTCRRLTVGAP